MHWALTTLLQVFSWGWTATVIFEVEHNNYGQHIGKTDSYHLEAFNKGLYGLAIVYPVALTFSKLSLLALYWRIFRVTSARRPLQLVAVLNIGWMIAAVSNTCCSFSQMNRPLTRILGSCWRAQLYTYSRLLGSNDQKPMHPISSVLHFE